MRRLKWIGLTVACAVVVVAIVHYASRGNDFKPASALQSGTKAHFTTQEEIPVSPSKDIVAPTAVLSKRLKSREDWYRERRDSKDYVAFVRSASAAAGTGDDGAAREMEIIMLRCALPLLSIRSGETKGAYFARLPNGANPGYVAHAEKIYDRCAPLANAKDFPDWETRPGGEWGVRYWLDLALDLGNPSAKAEFIVTDLNGAARGTAEVQQASLKQARAYARDILRSRDPEGWYLLGMNLGNPNLAQDVSLGYALALASCDMGYDCSGDNERNNWYACRWLPGCSAQATLSEVLEAQSPSLYAKAYAKYQQLTELIKRGDWDEIEKYAPIDGRLSERGASSSHD